MHLASASEEQLNVINQMNYNNVVVDSVAGSGKTTTILHIAKMYNDKILVLTYNRRLKIETRDKIHALKLKHVEVHNYHGFCCKYYNGNCYTDKGINDIIKNDISKRFNFKFDKIILDEAQDITPLYYKLIFKIIKDNKIRPKLCILGDRYQSIFGFNHADERFLIYAIQLFDVNSFSWRTTKLSTSFRMTKENADFLNQCVLGYDRIKTIKNGTKPRYIICDCFGDRIGFSGADRPYKEVLYYLEKYNCEDIFILAPSVKSEKSPIRQLANKMSNNGIAIYVPNSDEEKLDNDVMKGKVVFSTFHQTKGLERKAVIIFGFDNSYFNLFKKDNNPTICPNEIYVACTRSIECLTMLHHYDNDYLKFLRVDKLKQYCYFEECIQIAPKDIYNKQLETSVIDLLRHLPSNILHGALEFINFKVVNDKDSNIEIAIKSQQKDLWENVSDITGVAIPSYFELKHTASMTIWNCLMKSDRTKIIKEFNDTEYMFIDDELNDINNIVDDKRQLSLETIDIYKITVQQLLYIANQYCAYRSGYIYKLNQIKEYDWLSDENLQICCQRLEKYISKNAIFEQELILNNEKELFNRKLKGVIDCIDGNNMYEFKCVQELQNEHILQLAIYAYINEITLINKLEYNHKLIQQIITNYKFKYNEKIYIKENNVIKEAYIIATHNNKITIKVNGLIKKIDKLLIYSCPYLNKQLNNLLIEQEKIKEKKYRYFLFNILDNQMIEIYFQLKELRNMIHYIMYNKYFNKYKFTDEQFINNMKESIKIYNIFQHKIHTEIKISENMYDILSNQIKKTDHIYENIINDLHYNE